MGQKISQELLTSVELGDDLLVLTPNKRLQRAFHAAEEQMRGDEEVWSPTEVLAFNDWVESLWQQAQLQGVKEVAGKRITNHIQRSHLWCGIVADDARTETLLKTTDIAKSAEEAYARMVLWESGQDLIGNGTAEQAYFGDWIEQYRAICTSQNWITPEEAVSILCTVLESGVLETPQRICLMEFEDMPPLHLRFIEAARQAGSHIESVESSAAHPGAHKVAFLDRNAQLYAAATWARDRLKGHPERSIGIVCPDLGNIREEVLRVFTEVLDGSSALPAKARLSPPFNISTGVPLGTVPVVAMALEILSLGVGSPSLERGRFSALLRSKYLGDSASEMGLRARIDHKLQSRLGMSWSIGEVIPQLPSSSCLGQRIADFEKVRRNGASHWRPSQWAMHFDEMLNQIGWPGNSGIDSEEYQAIGAWVEALKQLSALDPVAPSCTGVEAYAMLRQMVLETHFQVETKDSPIQILGALEAVGLHFDNVWVLDMNDDVFPPPAAPNPMICPTMQQHLDMPHATAERELEYCQRLVGRFGEGATELVYSFSTRDGDRELRPSPLMREGDDVTLLDLGISTPASLSEQLRNHTTLAYHNDFNVEITPDDFGTVKGGTGILKAQAACPFQAFSRYLLQANDLPEDTLGLNHFERGELLHMAMEGIWTTVKSQAELAALASSERQDLITNAIQAATDWFQTTKRPIGDRVAGIERARMNRVVSEWLDVELERRPFAVKAVEDRVEVSIGGLPLTIVRDRIDELESGERIIIDYKTGSEKPGDWAGSRPPAPQIPIYAVTDEGDCDAVAVGRLKPGRTELVGIGAQAGIEKGIHGVNAKKGMFGEDWTEAKTTWAANLNNLVDDFCKGDRAVDPVAYDTCKHCSFKNLCRI